MTLERNNTTLSPIIKWAGGKEKELPHILPCFPDTFNRYIEPFVGGGSVFLATNSLRYFINDLSDELIALYRCIATQEFSFFNYCHETAAAWDNATTFARGNNNLFDKYLDFRKGQINSDGIKVFIKNFCDREKPKIQSIVSGISFSIDYNVLRSEIQKNLTRKILRMKELEKQRHLLPDEDIIDNIETAIKSALYMLLRHQYNETKDNAQSPEHVALFFFIRNYCYSGMFRYNDKGDFNVPYGGMAYNGKRLEKKINYYKNNKLISQLNRASFYNLDFEEFLIRVKPQRNDFVFLDPPYDSQFSTYAQNEFSRADQERLAGYLLNKCKAKWLLIIKNTDFIYNLYNKEGVNMKSFDKKYQVSFMNRNDKATTHLLISNY
ncbi:MAG: DNA adenine methylase [Muribaculaceae bacterium]|nr:DNA adenine methylase [Muribaculaceae bacterium]